jgi:hypothetical protein
VRTTRRSPRRSGSSSPATHPRPSGSGSCAPGSPWRCQVSSTFLDRSAAERCPNSPTTALHLHRRSHAAAKTDTFLGERYRRLVRRIGKLKALVAVARSILVIVWHLLADPATRHHDLGAGYWASRIDKTKKARNHIRQLEALGFTVTLAPAA